ncbi:hypothetical protein ABT160_18965 [Streptomyces sp. NPDC001941]|uniref:hypothetical protein n=1 Tax=Streptomyces sp. NPDC001941 TaxID=3154659 RepID=UPI00332BF5C9
MDATSQTSTPSAPRIAELDVVGTPEVVNQLLELLSQTSTVVFGPVTEPGRFDSVRSRLSVMLPSLDEAPVAPDARVALQTILRLDPAALEHDSFDARQRLEDEVSLALGHLPGVAEASSRVVTFASRPLLE